LTAATTTTDSSANSWVGQRAAIDITLEAVKEFQVVATGAQRPNLVAQPGVLSIVITKSGTNQVHGSLFHFQRLEALTANTSDGKQLDDFRARAIWRHGWRTYQKGQSIFSSLRSKVFTKD